MDASYNALVKEPAACLLCRGYSRAGLTNRVGQFGSRKQRGLVGLLELTLASELQRALAPVSAAKLP